MWWYQVWLLTIKIHKLPIWVSTIFSRLIWALSLQMGNLSALLIWKNANLDKVCYLYFFPKDLGHFKIFQLPKWFPFGSAWINFLCILPLLAHILSHAPNLGYKPQARVMIIVMLIKNIWKCLGSKFVNRHHQHVLKPLIWLLLHAKLLHQGLSKAQKCWFWRFMYFVIVR